MCGGGGGGCAIVVVVCLSVRMLTSLGSLELSPRNFRVVVGDGVRHVYLQNRPDPPRFGRKKEGNLNFIGGACM